MKPGGEFGEQVVVHLEPGLSQSIGPLVPELQRAVAAALENGGCGGREVSLAVVSDPTLTELHGRCLGDPTPTDVMSFELGEEGDGPFGEVVVSADFAERVAAERGVAFERELCLYAVHGTLHLCGMDDHEPEERAAMRAAERAVMGTLGFAEDRLPHDSP